jgi:hypothetical protein
MMLIFYKLFSENNALKQNKYSPIHGLHYKPKGASTQRSKTDV